MATKNKNIIELWRDKALICPLRGNELAFEEKYIFPSGRQAISYALLHLGLSRASRVAFPEWSSQCVINAIGRICTPVPLMETLKYKIKVDAVLLYGQWGWPLVDPALEFINRKRHNKPFIILDMVDSAHFFGEPSATNALSITSLAKLLGLAGGGLAFHKGKPLVFVPGAKVDWLDKVSDKNVLFHHICKEHVGVVPASVKNWLAANDLLGAIKKERLLRQSNLNKILSHRLAESWPLWMKTAVKKDAGPGIAPLLRGWPDELLKKARNIIMRKYGVETAVYHFNWSGNPFYPSHEKCLAVPIHSGMDKIDGLLAFLASQGKNNEKLLLN